jgi:hypothetical protein
VTKGFLITSMRRYYDTGHYRIGHSASREETASHLTFSRLAVKGSVIHRRTIVQLAGSLGQRGISQEPMRVYLLAIAGGQPRQEYDSRRLSGEIGNLGILSQEAHLDTHSL